MLVKHNYKILRPVSTAHLRTSMFMSNKTKSERRGSTVGALQIFNYVRFIHA